MIGMEKGLGTLQGKMSSDEGIIALLKYLEMLRSSQQGMSTGGYVQGPGTGKSDSIPAKIYQNGQPVQEARLSDGEFVLTKKAVDNGGGAAKMYQLMKQLEKGARF